MGKKSLLTVPIQNNGTASGMKLETKLELVIEGWYKRKDQSRGKTRSLYD